MYPPCSHIAVFFICVPMFVSAFLCLLYIDQSEYEFEVLVLIVWILYFMYKLALVIVEVISIWCWRLLDLLPCSMVCNMHPICRMRNYRYMLLVKPFASISGKVLEY